MVEWEFNHRRQMQHQEDLVDPAAVVVVMIAVDPMLGAPQFLVREIMVVQELDLVVVGLMLVVAVVPVDPEILAQVLVTVVLDYNSQQHLEILHQHRIPL
jgi:hypothetical protein